MDQPAKIRIEDILNRIELYRADPDEDLLVHIDPGLAVEEPAPSTGKKTDGHPALVLAIGALVAAAGVVFLMWMQKRRDFFPMDGGELAAQYEEEMTVGCRRNRIDIVRLVTDEPYAEALSKYLAYRMR